MHQFTKHLAFTVLSICAAACSKSAGGATKGVACDAAAITSLAQNLEKANGLGVDLTDKKVEAQIADAKASITGKHFAFTGCTFAGQGNDEVTFGAVGTDAELACAMQGGEADVKAFRHKAMEHDAAKLRLDVRGEIALGGTKGFERLQMTKCKIDVHE